MSGHSKWHSIKHQKAATDAKRGKVFTKLIREIVVCVRIGGGDEANNARLRTILQKAKQANMPADTVKKAIMRGSGELEGVNYEEVQYEGYGPGGVAVLIDVLTDNKNRTASEMRYLMSRNNGSMGEAGCVSWQFKNRGVVIFAAADASEDKIMEKLLDAGVEDISADEETVTVYTDPKNLESFKEAAQAAGFKWQSAEISKIPQNYVALAGDDARKAMKLIEALEDHDDVQNVYTNFEPPDELVAEA